MNTIITDKIDWKLRINVVNIEFPVDYKHFQFIGEQYNDKGEITNTSTYDFFLDKDGVNRLSQLLQHEAA